MAVIENPPNPLVQKLQGVHLFGFDAAPCSQRVSFALAEKGLKRARKVPWASDASATLRADPGTYVFRHVSLIKHENLTEAYAGIQPNMVVPALVHDGKLHIESMEIIDYLDQTWPENLLLPEDPEAARLCHELVALGKELHISIRHITFHWSLGKLGKIDAQTEATVKRLQREGSPEQLAEFYAQFNADQIGRETFVKHLRALEEGYGAQEARLRSGGGPFLTGKTFSTADIIWAIKVLRLTECGYPFARNFPHLSAWYDRIQARPGFQDGVLARNRFFRRAFRLKAGIENMLSKGIVKDSRAAA
jgi:glutathione S-transferase